jgi:hypothetical protein
MDATSTDTPVNDGFINSIEDAFSGFDSLSEAPEPAALTTLPEEGTAEDANEVADATDATDATDADSTSDNPLDELDKVDPDKDWTPQAAKRFKQLKTELKSSKSRLQELESSLAERETRLQELDAIAKNPEYEQLKTRVDDYERELLVTKLESSQIYKELVAEPLAELVTEADTLAEKYAVDANELLDAIALEDESAQEEALADLLAAASDRDRFRVYKIIEQIKPILHQRSVLQENAQEALREAEALQETQSQQQLVARAAERQQAASAVADTLRKKLSFLDGVDGVDLPTISKRVAEQDTNALSPVDSAYQSFAAQLLPKVAREYLSLRKELDSLTDKLAKYDRATPRAGGGGSSSLSGQSSVADGRSFADAVNAAFGG